MTLRVSEENGRRIKSAICTCVVQGLLGWALLSGLAFQISRQTAESLKTIDLALEPLPPSVPARPEKVAKSRMAKPRDAEGAASPANLKNTPSEILTPPPQIRLELPPPVVVAPIAGQGSAAAAGAAPIPGPGTGRGGQGTGLGSGINGLGTGGGGGGPGSGAEWLRGSIGEADYPEAAYRAHIGGTVFVSFVVGPSGRVDACAVTRSSGNRDLDATTCRLIKKRFRYRPARNVRGKPIAETVRGEQEWEVGAGPPLKVIEPAMIDR
jgi:protein TonB